MRTSFAFFFLLLWFSTFAQKEQYSFEYVIKGLQSPVVYLAAIKGNHINSIDSCRVKNERIFFRIPAVKIPAMYRIGINDSLYTDFIFNNEDIEMQSELPDLMRNMKVIKSKENKVLFDYWKHTLAIKDTMMVIQSQAQLLLQKSKGRRTEELDALQEKANQLNENIGLYSQKVIKANPNLFASVLIKAYQMPDYEKYKNTKGAIKYPNEKEFYRAHFFDNIDFSNPALLNTQVIHVAVNDYIATFAKPESTPAYNACIDNVLGLAKPYPDVFDYLLNYFLNAFEFSIWENVFIHIVEKHYLTNPRADAQISMRYQKKIANIREAAIGQRAFNLPLTDTTGRTLQYLFDIKKPVKLLFFYAPDCEHCEALFPELIEIYKQYQPLGLEIIAYAVEIDPDQWKKHVKNAKVKWVDASDLMGLASENITHFNIWMTPTLIILNKDNDIVAKPRSTAEIHAVLVQLLNMND